MLDSTNPDRSDSNSSPFRVYWGGPDRPSRCLRDLLEKRIHAVPRGGEILWLTYYFRDEGLASALVQAKHRGVKVRVAIEGKPRTGAVNSRVSKCLQCDGGLAPGGFRAINHCLADNRFFRTSRLHEKLYYFSHPTPSVLVGTFNPSGNTPEDPEILNKIGDQDRGHNMLVDIHDPVLVEGLYNHAGHLFGAPHGPWERFLPENNRIVSSGTTRILFFPRWQRHDLDLLFEGLKLGSTLRVAVSHLNDRRICKHMLNMAREGVNIEVIAHDTQRRVPSWVEKQMLQNGIAFRRYVHAEKLPMHNKFMLFESSQRRIVTFGSMNLSVRSLHANHELLVISEDNFLYQEMEKRWHAMLRETMTSDSSGRQNSRERLITEK